ncbi:MAG: CPXCG motif-containing cysteine-rich protein [Gemmatimonadaceae bacterium]|nr:CPXCG motif-containing cysteine-rich protein [Gemmatimonadaceae bacterium]
MAEDDFNLDEDFPLGDGSADDTADVICPYCSESVTIMVDAGGGAHQQYVEDCEVCCNPWQVTLRFVDGAASVEIAALDE